MQLYTLDDDGNPVAIVLNFVAGAGFSKEDVEKLAAWGQWKEAHDTHVGDDTICGIRVSTVFVGMDMQMPIGKQGPPLVFETMMFGGTKRLLWDRYSTRAEALEGHKRAVDRLIRDQVTPDEFEAWTDYP